jgi:hypothetical protein
MRNYRKRITCGRSPQTALEKPAICTSVSVLAPSYSKHRRGDATCRYHAFVELLGEVIPQLQKL